jgi:hypothetical protein
MGNGFSGRPTSSNCCAIGDFAHAHLISRGCKRPMDRPIPAKRRSHIDVDSGVIELVAAGIHWPRPRHAHFARRDQATPGEEGC